MSRLVLRFKKKADGNAALSCTRADGSVTWQRQEGLSEFFSLHDLTHYSVETVLRHKRGFFGLIAEGWDFSDFGTPWPRGPFPADADPSELIVGLLEAERACGVEWSAAEMIAELARCLESLAPGTPAPVLSAEALQGIRASRKKLFDQWAAVPPGEALELVFDLDVTPD